MRRRQSTSTRLAEADTKSERQALQRDKREEREANFASSIITTTYWLIHL